MARPTAEAEYSAFPKDSDTLPKHCGPGHQTDTRAKARALLQQERDTPGRDTDLDRGSPEEGPEGKRPLAVRPPMPTNNLPLQL